MSRSIVGSLVIVGSVIGLGTPHAKAQKIYWTQIFPDARILRANLNGSEVEDIVTGLSDLRGIAIDVDARTMYWIDTGAGKIQRANLDGSEVQDIITEGLVDPEGIAIDAKRGSIYWYDAGKIRRANLDGSDVQEVLHFDPLSTVGGIAIDSPGARIYWIGAPTLGGTGLIHRANLDGSNIEDLVEGNVNFIAGDGIALARELGKMYWTSFGLLAASSIQRANLDGSQVEQVLGGGFPSSIALDVSSRMMYWVERSPNRIQRANLDVSGVQTVTTIGSIHSLALDIPTVAIPTLSERGMLAMFVLLIVTGALVFRKKGARR